MKNTPFKMKGFSGFVNSPLKDHKEGHPKKDNFMRTSYTPPTPTKRPKHRKAFKFTKVGKFLRKTFGSGGGGGGGSKIKLGCGPGSCPR